MYLGFCIAETFFNLTTPIGETIKLNGDNYIIIGVLNEQGTTMETNSDNTILISITTAKSLGYNFFCYLVNFFYIIKNVLLLRKRTF